MNTMNPKFDIQQQQLDATITTALERKPSVQVPADFAARVAASLPAPTVVNQRFKRLSIARVTALSAAAVLMTALFVLAPHVHAEHPGLSLGIEMLLLAQLAGIGFGLMRLRESGL